MPNNRYPSTETKGPQRTRGRKPGPSHTADGVVRAVKVDQSYHEGGRANPAHYFVFQGYERQWRPLVGKTPPRGKVVVLRSVPGGLVAAGRNISEAKQNLRAMLVQEFERAGSVADWYRKQQRSFMAEFTEKWLRVARERLALEPFDSGSLSATLMDACTTN